MGIMKNLLLILTFISSFFVQAQTAENSNKVEPNLQVIKAFEKDFPKIEPVWRTVYDGDDKDQLSYEADFTLKNTDMTAVYNELGVFKVLEVQIKVGEIPVKISRYMAKNYPKNNIKKAAKLITNSGETTYELGITINGQWVDAIFNKEGDFLEMAPKG